MSQSWPNGRRTRIRAADVLLATPLSQATCLRPEVLRPHLAMGLPLSVPTKAIGVPFRTDVLLNRYLDLVRDAGSCAGVDLGALECRQAGTLAPSRAARRDLTY